MKLFMILDIFVHHVNQVMLHLIKVLVKLLHVIKFQIVLFQCLMVVMNVLLVMFMIIVN